MLYCISFCLHLLVNGSNGSIMFQLQFEFKPEKLNGVILLTGERDDLTGDFIAVLMNNGFIEFW